MIPGFPGLTVLGSRRVLGSGARAAMRFGDGFRPGFSIDFSADFARSSGSRLLLRMLASASGQAVFASSASALDLRQYGAARAAVTIQVAAAPTLLMPAAATAALLFDFDAAAAGEFELSASATITVDANASGHMRLITAASEAVSFTFGATPRLVIQASAAALIVSTSTADPLGSFSSDFSDDFE